MAKVKESGIYRHKNGHAIRLRKGDEVDDRVAQAYTLDSAATKARAERPERPYLGSVVDAPGGVEARAEPTLENRAEKTK